MVPKINGQDSPKSAFVCLFVCHKESDGDMPSSYERGAPGAAAAVVAVDVAARQVGRGHEREALVGAAVLSQRVHTLLTVGLPSVCHRTVAVGVPRHQIHAVLTEKEKKRENN